jgi:hypothetical protein
MISKDESIKSKTKKIIINDISLNGLESWSDFDLHEILEEYADGFCNHTDKLLKARRILNMFPNPELTIRSPAGDLDRDSDFDEIIMRSTRNVMEFICSYSKAHGIAKAARFNKE